MSTLNEVLDSIRDVKKRFQKQLDDINKNAIPEDPDRKEWLEDKIKTVENWEKEYEDFF